MSLARLTPGHCRERPLKGDTHPLSWHWTIVRVSDGKKGHAIHLCHVVRVFDTELISLRPRRLWAQTSAFVDFAISVPYLVDVWVCPGGVRTAAEYPSGVAPYGVLVVCSAPRCLRNMGSNVDAPRCSRRTCYAVGTTCVFSSVFTLNSSVCTSPNNLIVIIM